MTPADPLARLVAALQEARDWIAGDRYLSPEAVVMMADQALAAAQADRPGKGAVADWRELRRICDDALRTVQPGKVWTLIDRVLTAQSAAHTGGE